MNNILLCDDEEDILYALKVYLQNPEYKFFEAHTGKEALQIVKDNMIDLVLMDIMMPEMDGLTALSEIRKISNVPVLFLTAKGTSSTGIAHISDNLLMLTLIGSSRSFKSITFGSSIATIVCAVSIMFFMSSFSFSL